MADDGSGHRLGLVQAPRRRRHKKLRGAARFVLGADAGERPELDDDLRRQCAQMGIDPLRLLPQGGAAAEPEAFELWPEHEEACMVFWACRRQWRLVLGFGGGFYHGLDFAAVDVAMRRLRVPEERQEEVFLQLNVMEDEGVKVLNAAAAR